MRTKLHRIVLAVAALSLLSAPALAGVKSKSVTFATDVKLGGAVVKKGTYKVSFDEATKELSVLSGREVVAKSSARLEERKVVAEGQVAYTTLKDGGGDRLLLLVNMGGKYAVVSDQYTAQAGRPSTAN